MNEIAILSHRTFYGNRKNFYPFTDYHSKKYPSVIDINELVKLPSLAERLKGQKIMDLNPTAVNTSYRCVRRKTCL